MDAWINQLCINTCEKAFERISMRPVCLSLVLPQNPCAVSDFIKNHLALKTHLTTNPPLSGSSGSTTKDASPL